MTASPALESIQADLARRKSRAIEMRTEAAELFRQGRSGVQIAGYLAKAADDIILEFIGDALPEEATDADEIARTAAVIAVGGTGRGELAPYSDIDLLFLETGRGTDAFRRSVSHVVQSCWDAKLELGHSIRTVRDCIALSRQDAEIATSLTEARLLWGSRDLFESLQRRFHRHVGLVYDSDIAGAQAR